MQCIAMIGPSITAHRGTVNRAIVPLISYYLKVDQHLIDGVDPVNPKRGYSRSRMTYTVNAMMTAKTSI